MPQLCCVDTADVPTFSKKFFHKMTMVDDKAGVGAPLSGSTVWGTQGRSEVMYWGWTFTDQDIVVLTNPLAIRSNVLFTQDGSTLPLERQILEANKVVHALDWQSHVISHLRLLGLIKVVNIASERSRQDRVKEIQRAADRLAA